MNQFINNIYARLSSKFATFIAIILTAFLVGCGKPATPAKVIETKPFVRETESTLRIVAIEDSGAVYLGKHPGVRAGAICWIDNHIFRLEGKAQVGDKAILLWYYEDKAYDNGKVTRTLQSIGVRSVNHREYEEYFTPNGSYDYEQGYEYYEPTAGDNQPGTKK